MVTYLLPQVEQRVSLVDISHLPFQEIFDDPLAITPLERMLNVESSIFLKDFKQLLDIFKSIARYKDEHLFLIEEDFEQYLCYYCEAFAIMTDSNMFRAKDGIKFPLPVTLLYLAYFYFTGEPINDEITEEDFFLIQAFANQTMNILQANCR